jgi:hypothetical protein
MIELRGIHKRFGSISAVAVLIGTATLLQRHEIVYGG